MKLRRFWLLAGLTALVLAFLLHFGRIHELVHLLQQVRWYILVMVLVAQGFSYLSNALYYRSVLRLLGYEVNLRRLFQAALSVNFVNQVFPSGGLSGTSFLANELKGEVPVGKATLTQLARYVFTFVSFLLVLGLGFLSLFLAGGPVGLAGRVTLLIILAIIIGGMLVLALLDERAKVERWANSLARGVNRLAGWLMPKRRRFVTSEQIKGFFDEFYHGYHLLKEDRRQWYKPMQFALYGNLAEVATVYVVFLAFGQVINPGVVIAAYTLANILSLISFFSGGVGLYEATMVTTLVALGIPLSLAFSVVLVYRTLNFVLFLPLGFYYYRQSLNRLEMS